MLSFESIVVTFPDGSSEENISPETRVLIEKFVEELSIKFKDNDAVRILLRFGLWIGTCSDSEP